MKFYISILLTIFLFTSCSENKPQNDEQAAKNEQIRAKNRQTAAVNEATQITQTAQKLEKEGRGMDIYRKSSNPESQRECNAIMETEQKQISELDERIKKLPEPFNAQLTPITADLNTCVSCAKNAVESCVKSRATINGIIKQLFP